MKLRQYCSALLMLGGLISASPAGANEQGWALTQSAHGGAALSGAMTLYISDNGMRTTDGKTGINLMTHGPGWTVYIYNEKTKRLFSSPLQPWLTSFKQRNLVGRFDGASWRRGSTNGAVCGVRAYEFVMDKPPPMRTNSKALNGRSRAYGNLQNASLWVASDIKTPPEVSNILSKLYGVPDCQRIPLRVSVSESGKGKANAVDTTRVSQMSIPDSVFAVPRGFQIAKTDTDVFIDKESMDTLDDLLQDLDGPSTPKRRPGTVQQRPGVMPQQRPGVMPPQRPGTVVRPGQRPGQVQH